MFLVLPSLFAPCRSHAWGVAITLAFVLAPATAVFAVEDGPGFLSPSSGEIAGEVDTVSWRAFTSDSFRDVLLSGKPFVVEFTADWCSPCQLMERETFNDPRVIEATRGFSLLRVDLTEEGVLEWRAKKDMKVIGAPTLIFFAPGGKEISREVGFVGPGTFIKHLRRLDEPAPELPPTQGNDQIDRI